MRKSILILLALAVGFAGYSQKKPKINKANQLRESGELAEAKAIIDDAIVHEKTKDNGKTWYYRALIYMTIDTTSDASINSLADNALQTSMEAFRKAEELADGKEDAYYVTGPNGFPILMGQQTDAYYSYYYNKAIESFQNDDYAGAVKNFENSYYILPEDTSAYTNAAFAAHSGKLFDKAKQHYALALEKGANSTDLYYNYINILSNEDGDTEKALEILKQARAAYPTDAGLAKTEINLMIKMGRKEEALNGLIEAIKAEPNDPNLMFTLAVMYDEVGEVEKAKETYLQAMEVDPNHFESNFNYGVILINEANELIKESNNLGISKADQAKAKKLEPQIQDKLKQSLPQWERINEISEYKDQTAMETLAYIYAQLKMYDKAEEIKAKLDSL